MIINGWEINDNLLEARKGSVTKHLQPLTSSLLVYLGQRAGRAVSKDELSYAVWGRAVTDHAIVMAMTEVRKAVGETAVITKIMRGYLIPKHLLGGTTQSGNQGEAHIVLGRDIEHYLRSL